MNGKQLVLGKLIKGLYSATVAGLGSLATVLTGNASFASVHDGQWVTIALTAIVAGGGVYGLAGWSGPGQAGPAGPVK